MDMEQRMHLDGKTIVGTITESVDITDWRGFRTLNKKLLAIKCGKGVQADVVMTGGGDGIGYAKQIGDLVITITISASVRKDVRAKMIRKAFNRKPAKK